jgi:hypothetical protein
MLTQPVSVGFMGLRQPRQYLKHSATQKGVGLPSRATRQSPPADGGGLLLQRDPLRGQREFIKREHWLNSGFQNIGSRLPTVPLKTGPSRLGTGPQLTTAKDALTR